MIFDDITAIGYEGQGSTNPLAFKYYKADEIVLGRTMADWTRFAAAYWHTLGAEGTDMFGWNTSRCAHLAVTVGAMCVTATRASSGVRSFAETVQVMEWEGLM
jgi:xylose isomerase